MLSDLTNIRDNLEKRFAERLKADWDYSRTGSMTETLIEILDCLLDVGFEEFDNVCSKCFRKGYECGQDVGFHKRADWNTMFEDGFQIGQSKGFAEGYEAGRHAALVEHTLKGGTTVKDLQRLRRMRASHEHN